MKRSTRLARILPLLVLLSTVLVAPARSQPTAQDDSTSEGPSPVERIALQRMQPRFGAFLDGALNIHRSDARQRWSVAGCLPENGDNSAGGLGPGFDAGLLYELPIATNLMLGARVFYAHLSANQSLEAYIGPVLTSSGDDTTSGITGYHFNSTLGAIMGSVTIGWRPFDRPLWLRIGPEFGNEVINSVDEREELVSPASAVFTDATGQTRSRIRNETSYNVDKFQRLTAVISADYELPLNADETWLLAPEVAFSYDILGVPDESGWVAHQLRGGIAVKYSPPVRKGGPPPTPAPPPPSPSEPILAASLSTSGVTADGFEKDNITMRVEEFVNVQTRSLLHYVFFDSNSATLPPRYDTYGPEAPMYFSFDKLHNHTTLDVYHQILNIVGARMREHPEATLTLTGTNSATGGEASNRELSRARAEAVRDYLFDSWGIDTSRLTVVARGLPQIPSRQDDPDGVAENQRVEIASNVPEILEPVVTTDTLRTVDPPVLRLRPIVTADAGVGQWNLRVTQGNRELKKYEGTGELPQKVDYHIAEAQSEIPVTTDSLISYLEVYDTRGASVTTRSAIPIEQITVRKKRRERLGDIEYDRFNLITFDFDRSTLSPANQRIAEMIKGEIRPKTEVSIVGYTDRLGEEDHNLELSRQRALNTAVALGVPESDATGMGENTELHDNDLPEGRFYSRTVDVVLKTPVQE